MADVVRRLRSSVRVRATLGAMTVVAVVLAAAAVALVLLLRGTLEETAEDAAETRAELLAAQVEDSGLPATLAGEDDDDDVEAEDAEEPDDEEPEDLVSQVVDADGVVVTSQPGQVLPLDDGIRELRGGEHRFAVATAEAQWQESAYTVVVAASLEDADESVSALVPLLLVGTPLVLVVVGGVTWLVTGRALAPVERMRRDVATISDDALDRRVALPSSRDEVFRLAGTMNAMLGRLQTARDRQRRFVSDASHELRSPIATLRQTGEVARAHPDAIEPRELADTVVAESLRLQRLVDQLLMLTRADEGAAGAAPREVDLDDLLLGEAARARRERPDLTVDSSGVGPGRVHGNAAALDQVMRNLVDNALRHTRAELRLAVATRDGWVRVVVADDGAGVPEADRDRIFERFVRLDEARSRDAGGSGLGLAIVREIVAAHAGHVAVTTADQGGARFVVDLPAG